MFDFVLFYETFGKADKIVCKKDFAIRFSPLDHGAVEEKLSPVL